MEQIVTHTDFDSHKSTKLLESYLNPKKPI